MLRSLVLPLTTGLALSLAGLASPAAAQQYRGMPAGWPNYAAGYPAAPVNMAGYAAPLSVYAARPTYPTSAAYYAPTAGMAPTYGARTAYAAPTTAYYAPNAITAPPTKA